MSRYVATELAVDIVINIGEVKFYLHKVSFLVLRIMHLQAKSLVILSCRLPMLLIQLLIICQKELNMTLILIRDCFAFQIRQLLVKEH